MKNQKISYTRTDVIITKITTWISVIIIIALLIWGIITFWQLWHYEETNDAQIEEYVNPINSRVTGYVKEIRYEENQDVKEGDTLVIIEDNEYKIHKEEAEAALANAEAQIDVLDRSIETAATNAQVNQSQITAAQARLWKSEQEFTRYKKLLDAESVTQQQFEAIQTNLDVARADYQTLQNSYKASLAKVNDIKAQKAVALTEIQRRKATLDKSLLDMSYTAIVAPYDGKIGRRTIQKGQLIQTGQTLAFLVDQEEGKWVVANFKETQIKNMHIGQEVEIETDAFPGEKFHGKIESLSPATGSRFSLLPPDNATGNFVKIVQRIPVRIKLTDTPNKIQNLRAGMNAIVLITK
ncbi:HlyD family secretion protein [Cytophagaceae bacterium DM2B3-1]|uniref:HlyD family secretion protein n=1 Tax=Xanthocytophaga flava TaxID=3048013 RepID=A0ABT7CGG2_9BACT|nr:HlyD family secretion protein [Xanthocytophaga flavus]MDJ1468906.1 HlyD family secretion protein [Xanthocytophaga flavus]MDJ1492080.1 HlyD family secretion protein [Xanthocytophaga flavus]